MLPVDEPRCAEVGPVAGFFMSCSWLTGVAFSDFERAPVRLRVGVVFACSFASGDSDVFLMKMTPFYYKVTPLMMARISLHSHTKRLSPSPKEGDSPSLVQCQAYIRLRSQA